MEIILIAAFGGLAIWWFFLRENASKPKTNFSSESGAPYKVEVPVQQPTAENTPPPVENTSPPVENATPTLVTNPLDVNNDGKVNVDDVKEAVKKAKTRVKKAADVDGDGKVTKADAKAAVAKAKAPVKKKARTSKK